MTCEPYRINVGKNYWRIRIVVRIRLVIASQAAPANGNVPDKAPRTWRWAANLPDRGLFGLNNIQRLALEMALHEEAERRAMEGELAALELAWKEAEEIAAISDNLFLPGSVVESLAKLRGAKPAGEEPAEPR